MASYSVVVTSGDVEVDPVLLSLNIVTTYNGSENSSILHDNHNKLDWINKMHAPCISLHKIVSMHNEEGKSYSTCSFYYAALCMYVHQVKCFGSHVECIYQYKAKKLAVRGLIRLKNLFLSVFYCFLTAFKCIQCDFSDPPSCTDSNSNRRGGFPAPKYFP